MTNLIVLLILAVILIPAVRHVVLRVKGNKNCCGDAVDKVPVKKLEGEIKQTYLAKVEGMHCENCRNSIMRQLNALEGVSAKVNLSRKTVTVSCSRETDPELIERTIEKLGYEVTEINLI